MTKSSYKILAAQRLAIDPNALLMYFELDDKAIVTTPDGVQHVFAFADLDRPKKPVGADQKVFSTDGVSPSKKDAETPQKGPISPLASPQLVNPDSIPVAIPQPRKPKSVAKPKPKK
ncbi:MAG: hypothetical protein A2Z04_01575 [Chloroflexi bacterium RBG_16_57_9]|nr:MAG: hypothetical protein A2Z04_01575 [Chloroflexi bacterium RBG_16_57_9]